jgi:DNA-directed RNA polymerase specialized sigma54-like protein
MDDIAAKNTKALSDKLGIPEEGARHIIDFIKNNLNPYPGASFSATSTPAIPSFSVLKGSDGYKIINIQCTNCGPSI